MVKQCTLMEKKEMNMERAKYIFVCGLIVVLAWQNSKLQDRVNMMESINADSYRQINQNSLINYKLIIHLDPLSRGV